MNAVTLPHTMAPSTRVAPTRSMPFARICLSALIACGFAMAHAQIVTPVSAAAAVKPATPTSKPPSGLTLGNAFQGTSWQTLSAAQGAALAPLATTWATLSDAQKRKWISLSTNFAKLAPVDQGKLHARMAQWAALSPPQRELARLNFAEAAKIAPQQKSEKWQAYQALSPLEKQKLAQSVRPPPPRTALAAKPAPPERLSPVSLKAPAPTAPNPQPVAVPAAQAHGIAAPASSATATSAPAPAASSPLAAGVTPFNPPASTPSQ